MTELSQLSADFKKHTADDKAFQDAQTKRSERMERAMFGDGNGNKGMETKVDEMYDLLIQSRGILGLLGGMRGLLLTVVAVGAVIALVKGWFHPLP